MEGHDSLLLGWYPTPTTPAYPSVDLPPGPQAPSTSNLVRLPPGDYPDLRTPIIQQHEPGETTAAGTTSNGANTTAQTAGPTSGTATAGGGAGPATIHLPAAAAPAAATGGGGPGGEAAIVVNVAGRMGSASSQQNAQQQQHTLHLSGHHIVTPSVAQLHVTQAGTAATMVSGTSSQLGGQTTGTGAQVLQQVVAQAAGGGHQLVHMVLHHPAGTGQTNSATAAVSMGGTLQIGGLASVGSGVTVQALTAGMPSGGLGGGGIVNVGTLGVLEGEEAVGVEGGPPFRCEECGHVAKTKRMLKRHLATVHSQERNYPCPYCDAKFSQQGLRAVHEERAHGLGDHVCDRCGKAFAAASRLAAHVRAVHETARLQCPFEGCEYAGASCSKFLEDHVRARHTHERPFLCSDCGKGFSSRTNLRCHAQKHRQEGRFICHLCPKRFTWKANLMSHIERHNNPDRQFQCEFEQCSFTTKSAKYLCEHRRKHTGEFRFACNRCDRKFQYQFDYKRHLKSHKSSVMESNNDGKEQTTRKEYNCHQCDFRSRYWTAMTKHVRSHNDDNDKRYECRTCGKQFLSMYHFQIHMLLHRNKKTRGSEGDTGHSKPRCDRCLVYFNSKEERLTHLADCSGSADRTPILDSKQRSDYLRLHDYAFRISGNKRSGNSIANKNGAYCKNEASSRVSEKIPNEIRVCSPAPLDPVAYQAVEPCPFCDQNIVSLAIVDHFCTYHPLRNPAQIIEATQERLDTIRCIQCDAELALMDVLTHVYNKHGGDELAVCEHCCRMFASQAELLRHVYSHIAPSLACESCPFRTRYQQSLELHKERFCLKTDNSKESQSSQSKPQRQFYDLKSFCCAFCTRNWSSIKELVEHIWEKHVIGNVALALFACYNCGFATKSLDLFRDHKVRCESDTVAGFRISQVGIMTIDQNNKEVQVSNNRVYDVSTKITLSAGGSQRRKISSAAIHTQTSRKGAKTMSMANSPKKNNKDSAT